MRMQNDKDQKPRFTWVDLLVLLAAASVAALLFIKIPW